MFTCTHFSEIRPFGALSIRVHQDGMMAIEAILQFARLLCAQPEKHTVALMEWSIHAEQRVPTYRTNESRLGAEEL